MKSYIARIAGLILLFLLTLSPLGTVFAQGEIPPVPVDGNYVVDELGWLDANQVQTINNIVSALDSEGLAEIVILTKDDCGGDAKQYRYNVFNTWGVGHANKNDGLLIAVCWYGGAENRTVEQEVGYGMEGILPDTLTNKVAKELFVNYFKAGQPGEGLVAMVRAYNDIIRGVGYDQAIQDALQPLKDSGQYVAPTTESQPAENEALIRLLLTPICGLQCIWWLLIGFIILLIIAAKNGWLESSGGGTFTGGTYDGGGNDSSPSTGGGSSGGGGSSTSF